MLVILPFVVFMISFLILFIIVWLVLAAYCVIIGTAGLIPSIISRKQNGSVLLVFASGAQILSGIMLAFSLVYFFTNLSNMSDYDVSETPAAPEGFKLFLIILLISLVIAALMALAGAVWSIIRAVKSRKGRVTPKSLTIATALTAIPSALIFSAFSGLILLGIFSL